MDILQIEKMPNYYKKLRESVDSSSGSFSFYDYDFSGTSIPNDIEQLIKVEIKKQLTPIIETQKALIDQSAELSIQLDVVKDEVDNQKNIYLENYQLKKKIKNLNTVLAFGNYGSNWNGNNAEPFSQKVIHNAYSIINSTSINFQPTIFPTGRDSIQFEYEKSNGSYLEIEIFDDNYSAYSEINNKQTEYQSITVNDIFRLIDDFHSRF